MPTYPHNFPASLLTINLMFPLTLHPSANPLINTCICNYMKVFVCINCWDLGQTNSPTSARRGDGLGFIRIWATPPNSGDGLGFIRIWATPPNRLVFWDGAPSPS